MRSRIAGTGSHLPARRITITELAERAGVPFDALRRRTGIEVCHVAADGEGAADLGAAAAREALAAAGVAATDVDCVVLASHTAEFVVPGSAPLLAAKLDLAGVPAVDLRAQCSGFVYGLSIADHFIRLGTYRRVLVVASEVLSTYCDLRTSDPNTAAFTGDGAAAALVVPEPDETRGILGTGLHADGRFARSIMLEATAGAVYQTGGFEVVEEGYKRLSESLHEALAACRVGLDDVALFVPNAGALQVATLLLRRLRVPAARVAANVAERGNPGAASLPLSLDDAVRGGRIRSGDLVVLLAFGSGFTWGWAAVRW
jgi:3-oxoacyl-[acyl-carrier-protein] synthase III